MKTKVAMENGRKPKWQWRMDENQSGNGEWTKPKVAIENGRKPKWQWRMDETQSGNREWVKTKVAMENGQFRDTGNIGHQTQKDE
jgi:hypothetical protein